eukprot:jgi/Mesvir1/6655/Mv06391-RA.1
MSLENLYPLPTSVNSPTSRSPEYQRRINDLAEMYFTGHEIQELRTRVPNIRFAVEEADLYKRYIVHDNRKLLSKLQLFVASVYIYDLLTANLRELSDRVGNATQASMITTSRDEMAKLANSLRGYVAVECDRLGSTGCNNVSQANGKVYLGRVPHNVIARITSLEEPAAVTTPNDTDAQLHKIQTAGPVGSGAYAIRAFKIAPGNVPSPTYLLGKDPADDCMPARLIYQLASKKIDCTYLSLDHRRRLAKLEVDFPPLYSNIESLRLASSKRYGYDLTEDETFANYDVTTDDAAINVGEQSKVAVSINKTRTDSTLESPMRLGSQFKLVGATDKGLGLVMFENVIRDFIKRDIVAFNALRGQILDKIDVWWKRNGAMSALTHPEAPGGQDSIEFIKNIQKATYALTGTIPKCPNGSSTVWYDRDPTDPKARIVDETITAADGTRVRNPFARFGISATPPLPGALALADRRQLTEDEKEVVDAYRAEGEPALKGDTLTEWTASSVPSTGWVSCIVCSGIMPAHKVEFTRPVPSRDLFVFYHSTCFDSLTASDSLRVQERVPPAPPVPISSKHSQLSSARWIGTSTNPPADGSDLSAMTPPGPIAIKTSPVAKAGKHATGQASVGGGGSGGVLPAILGVGAAIGTIHFGAGVFPEAFKGADGKIDRTRLNVGGCWPVLLFSW